MSKERQDIEEKKLRSPRKCQANRQEMVAKFKEEREKMASTIDQARQKETMEDYWELLQQGQEHEALVVEHPEKMLADVKGLRDHLKELFTAHRRADAEADLREKRARRECAELERTLAELKGQKHK